MTPRKETKFRRSEQVADLSVTHRHAAGIDVHSAVHFVAVPVEDVAAGFINPDAKLPVGVRKFGTNTGDLEAIAAWLKDCGVTTVAMESTGVYWIPLYDLLASQGFDVILVDPRQTKHAPGRPKSDVLDCQWIRRLHSYGLLTASFRPADEIVQWRGFQRQREMLIRYAGQHVQHMQKALEEMNVKLTEVVSDIVGQTGMKIIRDLVRGVRDPMKLAQHRHERCKATEAEIASALYGNWRKEHMFALKQALKMYEFYQRQLRECDQEIETCLRGLADKSGGEALPPKRGPQRSSRNEPNFTARALLFRMAGVDLTMIEGISATTALVILSEIGTDLSRFPSEKNFVPRTPHYRTRSHREHSRFSSWGRRLAVDTMSRMDFRDLARDPKHRRGFEKLLLLACQRGDADLVVERLSWGVDPNCTFAKGRTPLIANVKGFCPNAATVQALLKAGADAGHLDETGLTALDYARRKLSRLQAKPRKHRKSPSLDENGQLQLNPEEEAELDRMRKKLGPEDGRLFFRMYWNEHLRAARRRFNDPGEVERIVELLEEASEA